MIKDLNPHSQARKNSKLMYLPFHRIHSRAKKNEVCWNRIPASICSTRWLASVPMCSPNRALYKHESCETTTTLCLAKSPSPASSNTLPGSVGLRRFELSAQITTVLMREWFKTSSWITTWGVGGQGLNLWIHRAQSQTNHRDWLFWLCYLDKRWRVCPWSVATTLARRLGAYLSLWNSVKNRENWNFKKIKCFLELAKSVLIATKMIAARAGIHWARGIFDA